VYLLVGAVASARQSRSWAVPLELALQTAEDRYARASAREQALAVEVAALREARLQGLSRRMNEAELVVDEGGRIVEANDRASELYDRPRAELLQLNLAALQAAEGALGAGIGQVQRAARDGVRFEAEHLRRDGARFPVALSVRTFEVAGRPLLHCLVRDLTEQRQQEAALHLGKERLRALALRVESAREEEKARMARDLHDDLGQALTALQLDLGWLEGRLEAQPATPWQGEVLDRGHPRLEAVARPQPGAQLEAVQLLADGRLQPQLVQQRPSPR